MFFDAQVNPFNDQNLCHFNLWQSYAHLQKTYTVSRDISQKKGMFLSDTILPETELNSKTKMTLQWNITLTFEVNFREWQGKYFL